MPLGMGVGQREVSVGQNTLEATTEHPGEGTAPNGLHSGKTWRPEFTHRFLYQMHVY